VPGSHRAAFGADRFDEAKFFGGDRADNAEIIRTAESPHLAPGDAVFFHCNTLHSAGKNLSDAVKFSLVYTYHGRSNATPPRGVGRGYSRNLINRLCVDRPTMPTASKILASARPLPPDATIVRASMQIHSPSGLRNRLIVRSLLTNR